MFGFNYNKPGKGVNKRDPNQSRISIFFELLWRKLWNLCKVNLFYLITAIPTFIVTVIIMGIFSSPITNKIMSADIIEINEAVLFDVSLRVAFSFIFLVFMGQGATTAAYTYTLRNYGREEHTFFFSDWWDYAKANFKQASIVWVIDFFAVFVFVTAIKFYANAGGVMHFVSYIILSVALIYIMMHFYVYQLMITFKNSIRNLYKNAVFFALQKAPQNLLMLLIAAFVHIGIPYMGIVLEWSVLFWIIFILAEFLVLPTLTGFMINFFIYPQLEKYIIQEKTKEE